MTEPLSRITLQTIDPSLPNRREYLTIRSWLDALPLDAVMLVTFGNDEVSTPVLVRHVLEGLAVAPGIRAAFDNEGSTQWR